MIRFQRLMALFEPHLLSGRLEETAIRSSRVYKVLVSWLVLHATRNGLQNLPAQATCLHFLYSLGFMPPC